MLLERRIQLTKGQLYGAEIRKSKIGWEVILMKKLIAIVLALICISGLVGCNTGKQETTELTSGEPQSGVTPAGEVFDIAVSYANWGDMIKIFAQALNSDTMEMSSVMHLPIYKFDTLAELERFKKGVKDSLSIDSGYDEVPSFNDSTAKYDEDFFAENTLMLVYIGACSGSYRYGVDSVYHANGNFCIHVKQTNNPEIVTDDMAGWFITVAVPDSMVADCTVFDADFQ